LTEQEREREIERKSEEEEETEKVILVGIKKGSRTQMYRRRRKR